MTTAMANSCMNWIVSQMPTKQASQPALYRSIRIDEDQGGEGRAEGALDDLEGQKRSSGEGAGKEEIDLRGGEGDGVFAKGSGQVAEAKTKDGERRHGADDLRIGPAHFDRAVYGWGRPTKTPPGFRAEETRRPAVCPRRGPAGASRRESAGEEVSKVPGALVIRRWPRPLRLRWRGKTVLPTTRRR